MGTVVNIQSGGRTALSGIVRAMVLMLVVLLAAPLASRIPLAVLAGIAVKVGIDIIDWDFLQRAHHLSVKAAVITYGVIALTVLVDLIAGRDRIRTFLALLNREATASGVAIQLYEPMASEAAAPPPRAQAAKGETTAKPSADPLLDLGYTKTSIALRVLGPYDGLQRFLQRMETLQVLVESSDLALESRDDGEISLGLRLSFYDRQPSSESEKPAAEADQQTSTPPPA